MLHNMPVNGSTSVFMTLVELQGSTTDFFLTGSRFFGNATEQSDWDFYAEYTYDLKKSMSLQGWKEAKACQYRMDPNVATVLKKSGIHVQLVRHLKIKHVCQEALRPFITQLGKAEQRWLWHAAYIMYLTGRNSR